MPQSRPISLTFNSVPVPAPTPAHECITSVCVVCVHRLHGVHFICFRVVVCNSELNFSSRRFWVKLRINNILTVLHTSVMFVGRVRLAAARAAGSRAASRFVSQTRASVVAPYLGAARLQQVRRIAVSSVALEASKYEFKAETRQLLDIVATSLYRCGAVAAVHSAVIKRCLFASLSQIPRTHLRN